MIFSSHPGNVLLASACPSVLIFAEDWTRKLGHIRNFLRVKAIYIELLGETRFGSEEGTVSYSLSGEQNQSRISSLLNPIWSIFDIGM